MLFHDRLFQTRRSPAADSKDTLNMINKYWLKHRWFRLVSSILGGMIFLILIIFCISVKFNNVSEQNLPKLIKANVVDPSLVTQISKFRSGAGHSNPGWPETCRSMKHYVTVYDPNKKVQQNFDRSQTPAPDYAIEVFSPVDGKLSKSPTGEGDDQLNITVDSAPGFSIRLEHVHLDSALGTTNIKVTAGEKIATVWNTQNFDVSVYYHYFRGDELFSYFEVLPDSLFAAWQKAGATDVSEFIFTREYRDAHPLVCDKSRPNTPNFLDAAGNITENWDPENFVQLKPNYDSSGKQK